MLAFLIRRLNQSIIVLLVMSVLVFVGVFCIGNPVDILIAPDATPAEHARAVHALGLDKPMWEQYAIFLKGALQGNLGNSFVYNEPALKVILERLPATLELAVVAMLMAVFVGIPPWYVCRHQV